MIRLYTWFIPGSVQFLTYLSILYHAEFVKLLKNFQGSNSDGKRAINIFFHVGNVGKYSENTALRYESSAFKLWQNINRAIKYIFQASDAASDPSEGPQRII